MENISSIQNGQFKRTDGFSAFHDNKKRHYDITATIKNYNMYWSISRVFFFSFFRFMAILGKFEF